MANRDEGKIDLDEAANDGRVEGSLVSIVRSMESVIKQVGERVNRDNLDVFCSTQKENVIKIKQMATTLISLIDSEFCNVNKQIEPSVCSEKRTVRADEPEDPISQTVQANAAKNDTLESRGILSNASGDEFIEKKSASLDSTRPLRISARFNHNDVNIKLDNDTSIMEIDSDFKAEVKIKHPEMLDSICSFEDAKILLLKQLRIVDLRFSFDNITSGYNTNRHSFLVGIHDTLKQASLHRKSAIAYVCLLDTVKALSETKERTDKQLLQRIRELDFMTNEMKEQVGNLLQEEEHKFEWKTLLKQLGIRLEVIALRDKLDESTVLIECLENLLREKKNLEHLRTALMFQVPKCLDDIFANFSIDRLLTVTETEFNLFSEIGNKIQEAFDFHRKGDLITLIVVVILGFLAHVIDKYIPKQR